MSAGFPTEQHDGQAAKRYFEGTHRTHSPAETLARLRPMLPTLGITRVANLTGLDRFVAASYGAQQQVNVNESQESQLLL